MRRTHRISVVGALAMTLVLPGQASAQAKLEIPNEKYTLPNGLQVILHQDRSVPYVSVNVWYHVGSGDERPGRTGFAHLFEHILFMGSENVPEGAFDQWLEAAGGNNNGSTNADRTNYYESLPSNALPLALWLESDRMGWLLPTMTQAKLDVQRGVVQNERRQRIDNVPYGRAFEMILATLYPPGHPYSWPTIGSMADLQAATLEDVNTFFRTYYAPNNASLAIAGDFEVDSAKAWVQRYFTDIPRGPALPPRPAPADVKMERDTFIVLEDRVQLPRVYSNWHSTEAFGDDDAALQLLAYVLAGDKNSRLYKRLVYDMQVAQDVAAFQNANKMAGTFHVIATPKPGEAPARIARLVDEEITKLIEGGITERELARAQNTTRAGFIDELASVQNKANQLNYYNYFVGTPDYTSQDAARFDRVTMADVQRVARTYLGAPKAVLTVVPAGKKEMMVTGDVQ